MARRAIHRPFSSDPRSLQHREEDGLVAASWNNRFPRSHRFDSNHLLPMRKTPAILAWRSFRFEVLPGKPSAILGGRASNLHLCPGKPSAILAGTGFRFEALPAENSSHFGRDRLQI